MEKAKKVAESCQEQLRELLSTSTADGEKFLQNLTMESPYINLVLIGGREHLTLLLHFLDQRRLSGNVMTNS